VRTRGTSEEVNACSSELQGTHAQFLAIKAICIHHGIMKGAMRLACDNQTGANTVAKDHTCIPANRKHIDLIRAICTIKVELPIRVQFKHVCGHQDDNRPVRELP